MNSSRRTAVLAGVLYIVATAAPILTAPFLGFLGGGIIGEPAPDYLVRVSASETLVVIGMVVELIWALAVMGIPVMLFPVLRTYDEASALGFNSLRFAEAICTIVSSLILLTLLTLSQEFAAAGAADASHLQALGSLLLAAREWVFNVGSGVIWSLSAVLLNVVLYLSKLVPRWLSVWGLVGAILSLVTYLVRFFGIRLTGFLFLPIALQEMVFAVWLIVKGFNRSALASLSAKTEMNKT